MSVTYGFYNALNHDRHYDSTQMSTLFDGIINDGIFASIGTCMVVTATTGNVVSVGIGRAWFNHTWTWNDAILPITADLPEVILDRIDAVVLEVNATESIRENSIKIVKGEPSSSPVRPTMIDTTYVHQHPLCYIYRKAKSTEITQEDITNMVGSEECPFITGILKTINTSELLMQWKAQFDDWFSGLKDILSGDVAGNLQVEIDTETADRKTAVSAEASARYAADEFLYKSTLTAAGWTAGTGTNSQTIYTQTVTPTKVNNGPNVTASMQFDNPRTLQTDVQATNKTLMEVLNIVNAGYTVTNAAGTVTVNVFEKPTADIEVYWKGTVVTS